MTPKTVWTVLLVTKDPEIRKTVKAALSGNNNRILTTSSAMQFFEKLNTEKNVDLIIFDPNVPSLKGLEAFSIAKSYHPDIPSILVYGREKYEKTKLVINKGVIYRMLKPINAQDLKEINESLQRRENHYGI